VDLWKDLITLLAVVDPIGTIPIYLTATMGMTVAAQRKVAVRATLIAAGVLTAFIVAGQIVLNAMGISLSAYQVAGGIVLFLFALQMVFDPGSHSQEADQSKGHDVAVFPIAIPSIAGPAAMMAVAGTVRTQAHTTRPATPQRTADRRRVAPTPTMAPVIVCVVDTGMPAADVAKSVTAAAVSAHMPPTGCSLVMRMPMVCTMRQPPNIVPIAIAAWQERMTQTGT